MKRILPLLFISTIVAGCKDVYRYPCQDPENWTTDYCSSTACTAAGSCTIDVMGADKEVNQKMLDEYIKAYEKANA